MHRDQEVSPTDVSELIFGAFAAMGGIMDESLCDTHIQVYEFHHHVSDERGDAVRDAAHLNNAFPV